MASFSVVTNVASINAQANLSNTTRGLQKSLNRLSSGFRINQAGDDAAGLAVANAYRSDIAIVNQGSGTPTTGCPISRSRMVRSTTSRPCSTGSPPWQRKRRPAVPPTPAARH